MSYSPRQRYSPPPRRSSRSRSRSPARSYRERHEDVENPGNNLYVTGLSIRVTEKDLEKYFAKVGEVRLQVKLDKLDWSQ
jgi:RNA recognition motif-containing protein